MSLPASGAVLLWSKQAEPMIIGAVSLNMGSNESARLKPPLPGSRLNPHSGMGVVAVSTLRNVTCA
jgi:hypothetical protein